MSLRVGAVGRGEKVVSHEAKPIQRSEPEVRENRSQKWQCRELGAALVGISPVAAAFPLSAPGGMFPGKKTATGKAANAARSYGPLHGATRRDASTRLGGEAEPPHGKGTATRQFGPRHNTEVVPATGSPQPCTRCGVAAGS